jgi:sugar O-acyltransferase (sialic acid O-acetyltransferase NeuD family)
VTGAVVLGFGGQAHVLASILGRTGVAIEGFFADQYGGGGSETIGTHTLRGTIDDAWLSNPRAVYVAIGDNDARRKLILTAKQRGIALPAAIHPSAIVEQNARVDEGATICAGAIVCAEAWVGPGCIVNSGAVVEHECRIGGFSHLAPRSVVAGRTTLGEGTFVGAGAIVAQTLTIGEGAIIGAGVVVLRDVGPGEKILKVHH